MKKPKKHRSRSESFFLIIAVLLIVVPIIVPVCMLTKVVVTDIYRIKTFDKEKFIVSELEKKYYGKFEVEGEVGKNDSGETLYKVKSSLRPDLTITATYYEGWYRGPMSAVPFNLQYVHEVDDDYTKQIIISSEMYETSVDLQKTSVDSIVNMSLDLIFQTERLCKKYAKYSYSGVGIYIIINYGRDQKQIELYPGMSEADAEFKIRDSCEDLMLYPPRD